MEGPGRLGRVDVVESSKSPGNFNPYSLLFLYKYSPVNFAFIVDSRKSFTKFGVFDATVPECRGSPV